MRTPVPRLMHGVSLFLAVAACTSKGAAGAAGAAGPQGPAGASALQAVSNAALKALDTSTAISGSTTVLRLGFTGPNDGSPAIAYTYSSSPCANLGFGDNGAQVAPAGGGGCWLANLAGLTLSPMVWGCAGNGTTDDTTCVQAAINGAAQAGRPLVFDSVHLYLISQTLTISEPIDLEGPFRYGIWPVNEPSGTGPQRCPWGLVTAESDIDLIRAQAVTGTIRGLCLDMSGGDDSVNPSTGAAINLAPPNATTFSSGWHIEQNTILNPFEGIGIDGNGVVNECCGAGTSADGIFIGFNTIISPAGAAISVGKNHTATAGGPGTVGLTVTDNDIVCKNAISKAQGIGVALYEGAIWYDGTQNGPEGCYIGTAVTPGTVSGVGQSVQLSADGVFGDQSGSYNLLVQPAPGGVLAFLSIGGKQPWASATLSKGSVLIDCTHAAACENITINNASFLGGNGLTGAIVDIEGGANGPFGVNITGSQFCQQGTPGPGATALKLNAGVGSTGRWTVVGNRIGVGCLGFGDAVGIDLTVSPGSTSQGSVAIVGNDISNSATPIAYAPSESDRVIIANNLGLEEAVTVSLASANAVSLSNAYADYEVQGSSVISSIAGSWQGRQVRFHSDGSGINLSSSGGNICLPSITNAQEVHLQWPPGGTCWVHLP